MTRKQIQEQYKAEKEKNYCLKGQRLLVHMKEQAARFLSPKQQKRRLAWFQGGFFQGALFTAKMYPGDYENGRKEFPDKEPFKEFNSDDIDSGALAQMELACKTCVANNPGLFVYNARKVGEAVAYACNGQASPIKGKSWSVLVEAIQRAASQSTCKSLVHNDLQPLPTVRTSQGCRGKAVSFFFAGLQALPVE